MAEEFDIHLAKAFEQVTTNNVKTIGDYSTATRDLVRIMEKKVLLMEGKLAQYEERMETLNRQLVTIQAKLYAGGSN